MTMRTLDLNEAAQFLRLHPHTLEAKARAGEVPGAKPGKCWVFLDVDLAEWLRAQYRSSKQPEAECHSTSAVPSIGANGKSAAKELGKRLAQRTSRQPRNITTAAVLNFGAPRSSAIPEFRAGTKPP
jgi:hypothetical protein